MGKRSDFERQPRDFYPTPFAAVEPLIEHLPQGFTFAEPCAGDGQLCRHLEYFGGDCMWASDKGHHNTVASTGSSTGGPLRDPIEGDFPYFLNS